VGEEVKFTYRHRGGSNREGVKCDHATEVTIKIDEVEICPWALREGIVLKWLDWMEK